jgi:hypothetical protein
MLATPEGVPGSDTPYSVVWSAVNCATGEKGHAVRAYKEATGQLPSELVNSYGGHFVKTPHVRHGSILTFSPGALSYLLGHTEDLPGRVDKERQ